MKKDIYILGIESSCDDTSMSIVKNGTEEIVVAHLVETVEDVYRKICEVQK